MSLCEYTSKLRGISSTQEDSCTLICGESINMKTSEKSCCSECHNINLRKSHDTFFFYFMFINIVFMHVCVLCPCLIPKKATRGSQLPWNWKAANCHIGAGNKMQVLCSKAAEPSRQLPPPQEFYYDKQD